MAAGQRSGTGARTELDDEKVRKNDVLSNRDKAQRPAGQSLDGKGVQVDEYKDVPTNRRPTSVDNDHDGENEDNSRDVKSDKTAKSAHVDRPGFDLGGSTGETHAGKGLGLGDDAKKIAKDGDCRARSSGEPRERLNPSEHRSYLGTRIPSAWNILRRQPLFL